MQTLQEFLTAAINQFSTAEGNEVPGNRYVDFGLAVLPNDKGEVVLVDPDPSTYSNRIKFTLEIARR